MAIKLSKGLGSILLFLAASSAIAQEQEQEAWTWDKAKPSETLDYVPCIGPFYCAQLLVPLDYSDKISKEKATIAIIKLPAQIEGGDKNKNWKGPILFNPGGPGGSGVQALVGGMASRMSEYFGPEYDYVSWDPRGVGYSSPRADCFTNPEARSFLQMQMDRAFDADGKPTFHEVAGIYKARAMLCNKTLNSTAPYMGTASVARDMLRIHEESWKAAGKKEEKGVQFWGQSYGTMLAVTFASMFPDKVERFIVDGNTDPYDYMSGRFKKCITDGDKVFETFYTTCAKSKACPMNPTGKASPESLRRRVNKLLDTLKTNPIPVVGNGDAGLFTYSHFVHARGGMLYSPIDHFPFLAQLIVLAEARDPSIAQLGVGPFFYARDPTALVDPLFVEPNEALPVIGCGDSGGLREQTAREVERDFEGFKSQSKILPAFWMRTRGSCNNWSLVAKERISKFGGKSKNPILFVGNTWDPSTPLGNTKTNSKLFPGSAWFEQESAGHLTTAAESECTRKILAAYMKYGKLPRSGTKCKPDWLPFERPDYSRADGYSIRKPLSAEDPAN